MTQKQFENTIKAIMKHNEYSEDMITESVCDAKDKWTPCSLILREYYNNGCGSAKGFLGITPQRCENAYHYIIDHKEELISKNMINKDGWNNSGFSLWKDYKIY